VTSTPTVAPAAASAPALLAATSPMSPVTKAGPPAAAQLVASALELPDATGPVSVDYIAYDESRSRIWVPVGDTGSADVLEIATHSLVSVDGFNSAEHEWHGKKRRMGPNAVSVGDGVVYIGNRASSEVCPIDEAKLKQGICLKLPSATDGVVYVASAKEVWVTTPRDQSLTVLDASHPSQLKPKLVIKTPGKPEGYAVDNTAGIFYTNLEDQNQTLVVDIKTHSINASWPVDCGEAGPRGLALDTARHFVFVACTSNVQILDTAHGGTRLGTLETGAGVDNIDYRSSTGLLYVAAGKAERLSVAHIDDTGKPSLVASGVTVAGARNAVADAEGNIYVVDPGGARLLVFITPPSQ